jgi:hypothetical protein
MPRAYVCLGPLQIRRTGNVTRINRKENNSSSSCAWCPRLWKPAGHEILGRMATWLPSFKFRTPALHCHWLSCRCLSIFVHTMPRWQTHGHAHYTSSQSWPWYLFVTPTELRTSDPISRPSRDGRSIHHGPGALIIPAHICRRCGLCRSLSAFKARLQHCRDHVTQLDPRDATAGLRARPEKSDISVCRARSGSNNTLRIE